MSKMKDALQDKLDAKIRHFQNYWTHKGMIRAAEHVERFPCVDLRSKRKLERVGAMLRRKADELRGQKMKIEYKHLDDDHKKLVDSYPEYVMTELERDAWFSVKAIGAVIVLAAIAYVFWRTFGGAA